MIAVVKDLPPLIRPMQQSDLGAVAAIEAATYDYPWSIGIFRDCLLAGYTNFVLDSDGEPVGYGIMSIAAGEAHLLNICVLERLRRQGIGRRLLDHMMQLAQQTSVERIYLEVRPSNKSAFYLYDSAGFEVLGLRESYYKARNGKEDAVVLVRYFHDVTAESSPESDG
ncbi:MAG: ribosomal protein S18-alanine N-acetyltransferase [Gammaproteobacteria bacterium]|jgi:ribosomal-protein-alanine N-acetyltransferase|nr:ribosomal-protein-alanine N-acetyltransferase [Chromatiales bacterium]MDP6675586.1 ribosomal protein S18-alanine N-acetyltransferase [Gammaproteobacteria bacterium]